MIHLIASSFVDELASLQLEKMAFDLEPARLDKITKAIKTRWEAAGIDPKSINDSLYAPGGMRSELQQIAGAGGAPGTPTYRAAQERARDLSRAYAKYAPGKKTVPRDAFDALVARLRGKPSGPHTRIQQMKPRLSTHFGNAIRRKIGLNEVARYGGASELNAALGKLLPQGPGALEKSLQARGEHMTGVSAAKDLKAGTGKGIADAARKTLLPGLKSLPTAAKIVGGIGAGLLGKRVLFGDDDNTTITVG